MIDTISYRHKIYPKFQSEGFAAKFIFPFAQLVCKGKGVDVGCSRPEWALPGAIQIDPTINGYDAHHFPDGADHLDYVFSSHCLEHVADWVGALDYWTGKLAIGGVLFLYLPHPSQEYWLPFNNRKHYHAFDPEILKKYLEQSENYMKIFTTGVDLNNSFAIMAEKI